MLLTLLVNLMIGCYLAMVYKLRRHDKSFLVWSIACFVFVAGGCAVAARAYIDQPLLTYLLADLLLLLSPALVVTGLVLFLRGKLSARSRQQAALLLTLYLLPLSMLYQINHASTALTSLSIAVVFIYAVVLLKKARLTPVFPVYVLQLFFALHSGLMLLQFLLVMPFIGEGSRVLALPSLQWVLLGHVLLTTSTGFMLPLLSFSHTENQLLRLTELDDLTQLLNRREFLKRANQTLLNSRRQQHSVVVLMIDLDHFKLINDRWGHAIGDLALKKVADLLKVGLRTSDLIGRLGGEEFAVLMPNTSAEQAAFIGQRLCERIAHHAWEIEARPVKLTVSVGGATCVDALRDLTELLKDADDALYQAKASGRNKIIFQSGSSIT
ncbi:MAG: GGDEF domain-containing protein [Gammaproteobacteria bacterium]|nr:GGDEF domain-containing protein [Gammaproteobacteria bacterium]MBU2059987.1 GGDEF domain-containing protein [Gammaproteobacteria bacterium]MBU2174146.1 GGDEF domain-containing protein [Gammaproteobacteria bacterium]MBU2248383.1 GGDEF domain-containing protein [Gammaproteobacteria bacterium]MBU2343905.1 GGDEF domain-containing protein [Gammaproteobacteria bacterium]